MSKWTEKNEGLGSDNKLHRVATGIDDNYLGPFLVMLYSAWKSSSQRFELIVGFNSSTLSTSSRSLIQDSANALGVSVEFVEVNVPAEISSEGHISPSAFIRLLLADILEETFVWLDSDLVCEEGWEELLSLKVASPNIILYAAYDPIANIEWEKSNNASVRNSKGRYFNSGVMVLDAKAWSRLGFPAKWRSLIKKYGDYNFQWADQCVINYLATQNFMPLRQELNFQEQVRNMQLKCVASIRHFSGPIKPWHYKSIGPLVWSGPFSQKSVRRYLELQSNFQSLIRNNVALSQSLEPVWKSANLVISQVPSYLHVAIAMRLSELKLRIRFFTKKLKTKS
jgi:lipopolysaccharide biosynthesis glycosyltransferase